MLLGAARRCYSALVQCYGANPTNGLGYVNQISASHVPIHHAYLIFAKFNNLRRCKKPRNALVKHNQLPNWSRSLQSARISSKAGAFEYFECSRLIGLNSISNPSTGDAMPFDWLRYGFGWRDHYHSCGRAVFCRYMWRGHLWALAL